MLVWFNHTLNYSSSMMDPIREANNIGVAYPIPTQMGGQLPVLEVLPFAFTFGKKYVSECTTTSYEILPAFGRAKSARGISGTALLTRSMAGVPAKIQAPFISANNYLGQWRARDLVYSECITVTCMLNTTITNDIYNLDDSNYS